MSFEQLQQAIFEEAKEKIFDIKDRYEKEIAREEKRIKDNAREVEEDIINEAELQGEQESKRLHQAAQLKAKADILTAKQEELEITKNEVRSTVLGWGSAETAVLLKALFKLLPDDGGEISAGSVHETEVRKIAGKLGYKVSKKTIKDEGGFIYRGKKSEMNVTTTHLVEQLISQNRTEIAKVLFG